MYQKDDIIPSGVISKMDSYGAYRSKYYKDINYCIVSNDGVKDSLVKLIGLKTLFARQLPKMPKEYIVRLVFDRRHKCLALLSDDPSQKGGDEEIIGGICYRAYYDMMFAEIAFCAVSASQQVKGYGTKMMNLLKNHAVLEGIEYFITFADNYAIGYFKKQGFTKCITMPKERYHGLIKEYDGGTVMECYVHPSIDYTRIPQMIKAQREFILNRVRHVSRSDKIIYPPLSKNFKQKLKAERSILGSRRSKHDISAFVASIPGVAEAGWTIEDIAAATSENSDTDSYRQKNHLKSELLSIMRKIEDQQFAWPFREPVNTKEVTDYLDIVSDPIDLSTISKRIRKGDWYKSKKMVMVDLKKMVNNCRIYNDINSPYYECALSLEKFLTSVFPGLID